MINCMAANWKMFKTRPEAKHTCLELLSQMENRLPKDREVVIFPPFTALQTLSEILKDQPGFYLGAQNFYPASEGSYTGEISPDMLLDLHCSYALAGHSERRHILGETDDFISRKVNFGLEKGLKMILCIGETLQQRQNGNLEAVLQTQIETGLKDVTTKNLEGKLAIAYEPVWAIGTGEVAGPKEIAESHSFVRELLKKQFGEAASNIRILYGGSVKPENCSQIMSLDNVNGVLVGGASLQAESFEKIILS